MERKKSGLVKKIINSLLISGGLITGIGNDKNNVEAQGLTYQERRQLLNDIRIGHAVQSFTKFGIYNANNSRDSRLLIGLHNFLGSMVHQKQNFLLEDLVLNQNRVNIIRRQFDRSKIRRNNVPQTFTANNYVDRNRDGLGDFDSNNFPGLRNLSFVEGESALFGMNLPISGIKGKTADIIVYKGYNKKGEKVRESNFYINNDNWVLWATLNVDYYLEKFGPGNYNVHFHFDNKHWDEKNVLFNWKNNNKNVEQSNIKWRNNKFKDFEPFFATDWIDSNNNQKIDHEDTLIRPALDFKTFYDLNFYRTNSNMYIGVEGTDNTVGGRALFRLTNSNGKVIEECAKFVFSDSQKMHTHYFKPGTLGIGTHKCELWYGYGDVLDYKSYKINITE